MRYEQETSEAVFQSLLDHFWMSRELGLPKALRQSPKGYLISYNKLFLAARAPVSLPFSGSPLYQIAAFCSLNGLPTLDSLVVGAQTGYPGDGYFGCPGKVFKIFQGWMPSAEAFRWWEDEVKRCIGCDKFPRKAAGTLDPATIFLHT
jgi:hypothetical protein